MIVHAVVSLKVPTSIEHDREAIDDWLNNLDYSFKDEDETEVETEIVENQFTYEG